MIAGAVWFYSFLLVDINSFCSFIMYHYCIICLGSYIIYFMIYFMIFLCYILSLLIIYYQFSSTCYSHIIQRICFIFNFCVCCYSSLFLFSSDFSVRFSSSAFMKPPFLFTPFSFPFLTLLSFSSPFLHTSFYNFPSLFWLSITKSKAFVLLSSSDSSFNSCPSILFSSCCSIFNLFNNFFSF